MQPHLISIVLNGQVTQIAARQSVFDLLRSLEIDASGVAVEINRSIVRKNDWPSVIVPAGAQVEIVQFVGGG